MALQGPINHRPKFLKGSVGDACKMFMTLGGIFRLSYNNLFKGCQPKIVKFANSKLFFSLQAF